jgi:hypothetical protein
LAITVTAKRLGYWFDDWCSIPDRGRIFLFPKTFKSGAEVKKAWSHFSTLPHVFVARRLILWWKAIS